MIPVASVEQMRECDRVTIEELGVPGILLMETAARAVTSKCLNLLNGEAAGKKVVVCCGKGNNGGDGFASARHLYALGAEVEVALVETVGALKGDAQFNADLFVKMGGKIIENVTEHLTRSSFNNAELIIDALLGTGFQGMLREEYAAIIREINDSPVPVVAVDIPSGVDGNTGTVVGSAVKATSTVTFGLHKPGLLIPPGRELACEVVVADIGIPKRVVDELKLKLWVVEEEDVRVLLPRRSPAAHKGDVGYVYILAASPGLTGAAVLCAEAAMRSGCGLTMVGVPRTLNAILESKLTEAMTQPLPETEVGTLASEAMDLIVPRLQWATAVAIGPGMGRHPNTGLLLEQLLATIDKPLVMDADGLNMLADRPQLLDRLPTDTILTPHPGELARLTGLSTKEILSHRVEIVRRFASEWKVTILLKGSPSITAQTDGTTYINSTGNAGMATGGSGDVLTGIIVSLIAQGVTPPQAAWMGAYIHGKAGDIAAKLKGEAGMVAGDMIANLPEVLRGLSND